MESNDTLALVVIQKVTQHLDAYQTYSNSGDAEKAREETLQAKTLLELINPIGNHPILQQCKLKLVEASQGQSTSSASQIEDPFPEPSHNPSHIPASSSPTELHTDAILPTSKFSDIVGNSAAKESLYENVVLPMLLPAEVKRKVFCGIRGNVGNVMLYGPPGTGKTILARA